MRVLIISGSDKGHDGLTPLFKSPEYDGVVGVKSGVEAKRLSEYDEYDIILINTPLKDEFGTETALFFAENTTAGIMMIVQTDIADDISSKVAESGIYVLSKPISPSLFYQALRLCTATRGRLQGLKKENARLKTTIDEMRLLQRAKSALMEYLKMSEPAAHRYIEKQAMDLRLTKREVAQSIIRTYEN
ncbi:MAG: response regulator receiver protein [Clostridiales bacterium]|nr:MAG: response regulator receiver protein [Clostridiales bacterium]